MTLSTQELQQRVDAYREHKTYALAADAIGVKRSAFGDSIKRAAELGLMGTKPVIPGFAIKSIASKDGDAWVKQVKEHGEVFVEPEGHFVKGVSALVDAEGRTIQKWVKTGLNAGGVDFLETIKSAFADSAIPTLPAPRAFNSGDLLAVYPIVDLHLGLYAWAPEVGADYDLNIASAILKECVRNLVARSANASTALVLDMGDYFHADSSRNQTAKSGNPLDVDGRRGKIAQAGVELTAEVIDLALQKHDRVIYRKLPGNHDEESSPMLAIALSMRYRNNPRVTCLVEHSRHFMYQHGEVMIAATHGDMLKMGGMSGFMAANWPKVWGATEHRYAYTGHVHHDSVKSGNGVRAESFNTLAAKDAWHAASGYVSARSAVSITMHKTEGEIDRLTVNLPSFKRPSAANDNYSMSAAA